MTAEPAKTLDRIALRVREWILRMSTQGGAFAGAALSCADLLVFLYSEVLRVSPETVNDPSRDYLFLSKGHAVPALYGTLVEMGFLDEVRLDQHLTSQDSIYWHPNRSVSGVEFHSGSLGHLLSVGAGVALDIKLRKADNRVFVILGDGELNEGSVWEGVLLASAMKLDNLVAIIDRNKFQANMRTEDLVPIEPLGEKFESFGWSVRRIDGHSFEEMSEAFGRQSDPDRRPIVVIADTVRGKGVASIEGRADKWFANFSDDEVEACIRELRG